MDVCGIYTQSNKYAAFVFLCSYIIIVVGLSECGGFALCFAFCQFFFNIGLFVIQTTSKLGF